MADPPGQSHSAQGDPEAQFFEWHRPKAKSEARPPEGGSADRISAGQDGAAKGRHFHAHAHGDIPCLLGSWHLMAWAFPGFVLLS